MANLSYSSAALNSLTKFHRKPLVIYVEGQDDVLFWNILFKNFGLENLELKPAGGVAEINKYSNSIINDDVNIVVARDCDYSDLLGTQLNHVRIIHTYGYSIENSLYCSKSIASIIATHARTLVDYESDVVQWFNEFAESNRKLLEFDLANEIYGKGIKVMGDNCHRFLKSDSSHLCENKKISDYTKSIENKFDKKEISDAENRIKRAAKSLWYLIRGHFLTHAIINFIKHKVSSESHRSVTISGENLYGMLISNFEAKCMNNKDVLFIEKQVNRLKTATST